MERAVQDLQRQLQKMEARLGLAEEKAALAEEKAALAEEKSEALQQEVTRLRAEQATEEENKREQEKQYVVMSAARVAKDESARGKFREHQVADGFCKGGFVAHKFYLDFVLAAREVRERTENLEQVQKAHDDEEVKKVIEKVQYLGEFLSRRKEHSMLNPGFTGEEGPQSAMAAEMFRLAIDSFQKCGSTSTNDSLRVTHQQHLVSSFQLSDGKFDVIQCTKSGDEKTKTTKTDQDKKIKADDRIDICVWFCHPDLGTCVLAACEYKPNSNNPEDRVAQVDIYGSNILVLHQKPCIVIDIAGGSTLTDWKVSVCGLIKASFTAGKPSFEKTPLYEGNGAEAIAMVARGLVAAHKSFPNRCEELGQRLGPVVGVIGDHVYKAYDGDNFRKPNIKVIQHFLDKNAKLFSSKPTSKEGNNVLHIVKMKKFVSDWKTQVVNASVFGTIIK
eukprot:scaffold8110_cov87-Cylindrotheca_fusiformis.AAC.1